MIPKSLKNFFSAKTIINALLPVIVFAAFAGSAVFSKTIELGDAEAMFQFNGTDFNAVQTGSPHWYLNAYKGMQIRIDSNNDDANATFNINNGGNATVLTVKEDGNVGIGTTGPDNRLHIYDSTSDGTTPGRTTPIDVLTLQTANTASSPYRGFGQGLVFRGRTYQNSTVRDLSKITSVQTDDSVTNTGTALTFFTVATSATVSDPVEHMRINYNGNVGIGITNPSYPLHVSGNSGGVSAAFSNALSIGQPDPTNDAHAATTKFVEDYVGTGGGGDIYVDEAGDTMTGGLGIGYAQPAGTDLLVSGNVGIGTEAPGYPLHIIDDNATSIVNTDSDDAAGYWTGLRVARQGSEKWFVGVGNTADDLLFRREGTTNDVTISTSGVLSGNGSGLTSLNASNLSSGTVPDARLSYGSGIDFSEWDQTCANNQIPKRISGEWQCAADNSGDGAITGSGTTNYVPKWTGSESLGNSAVYDDSGNVAIGHTNAGYPLHIMDNNSTSIVSVDSNDGVKRWSGLRIARQGSEKWFVGLEDNANDSLVFRRADATNDVTITSAGNVGIGTTDPGTKLEINQGSSTSPGSPSTYGFGLDKGGFARLTIGADDTYAYIQTWSGKHVNINNQGNDVYLVNGGGSVGIGTAAPSSKLHVNSQISIGADDNNRGVITYTGGASDYLGIGTRSDSTNYFDALNIKQGSVGIGTTGPARPLEVVGGAAGAETILAQLRSNFVANNTATTLRFGNSTSATDVLGTAEITARRDNLGATDLIFRTSTGSAVTERIRILAGGNVGIGTTNPGNKLTVAGTAQVNALGVGTASPGNTAEIAASFLQEFRVGSGPGLLLHNTNTTVNNRALFAPAIYFQQEYSNGNFNNYRGRILSYLGGEYLYFQRSADSGSSWEDVASFRYGGTSIINAGLNVGGALGVGGTLDINTVTSGTGLYLRWNSSTKRVGYASSSRKSKENIVPYSDDYDNLLDAELRQFTYKNTGDTTFGYIAEELEDIGLRNLVIYDPEDPKQPLSIKWEGLSMYNTEILKAQRDDIEQLQKENELLRGQLQNLSEQVAELRQMLE